MGARKEGRYRRQARPSGWTIARARAVGLERWDSGDRGDNGDRRAHPHVALGVDVAAAADLGADVKEERLDLLEARPLVRLLAQARLRAPPCACCAPWRWRGVLLCSRRLASPKAGAAGGAQAITTHG